MSDTTQRFRLLAKGRDTFTEAELAFGREVLRVHTRYAEEVVLANQLCPFLKEPESGFGTFCVMLDTQPDLNLALEAVTTTAGVLHLIFPRIKESYSDFWSFSSALGQKVQKSSPKAPVYAVFHPQFPGDTKNPHRLVGLLRRAPDPMIQYIPPGLTQGGTVFIGQPLPPVDNAELNYKKLAGPSLEALTQLIESVHRDRDQSYEPLLQRLENEITK